MELEDNVETGLKREENYTLNVTVITDYASVTSTTDFGKMIEIEPKELLKQLYNIFSLLGTHSLLGVGNCCYYSCVLCMMYI